MQFQMRQERQLSRHLRERLYSLFQGRMAFLIYGKLRKNVRVCRIFEERQTGSA